jgi:pilus assembly protein Flp/PilA
MNSMRGISPAAGFPGHRTERKTGLRKPMLLIKKDCDGQDLVEYGLLIALVALGLIAALTNFQGAIGDVWQNISNNLAGN